MPITEEDYKIVNETYYRKEMKDDLIAVIEVCRTNRTSIQVHYGDLVTGEDLLEENDIRGKIGRSMGPIKVPLLVSKGDDGGPELFSHIILITTATGKVLYKHPNYHLPKIQEKKATDPKIVEEGYEVEVFVNDQIHARFKSQSTADLYYKKVAGPGVFLRKKPNGILELEREE